jgi:hypothetical protein
LTMTVREVRGGGRSGMEQGRSRLFAGTLKQLRIRSARPDICSFGRETERTDSYAERLDGCRSSAARVTRSPPMRTRPEWPQTRRSSYPMLPPKPRAIIPARSVTWADPYPSGSHGPSHWATRSRCHIRHVVQRLHWNRSENRSDLCGSDDGRQGGDSHVRRVAARRPMNGPDKRDGSWASLSAMTVC